MVKSVRATLNDALDDLDDVQLKKFKNALTDRKDEPRVRRGIVQNMDRIDLADILVSTFTESRAIAVAVELLKEIRCNDTADSLGRSAPGPDLRDARGGMHFVDQHRSALIQRVSLVPPILDAMLEEGIITQEGYNEVKSKPTSQEQMRALFNGPLVSSGTRGKDFLLKFLEENDRFLIEDLKEQ